MKIEELKKYKEKKVAILGYGKEGKSSLNFLLKLGFKNITICDKNSEIEKKERIKYSLGETYIDNLDEFDLIIKSPGISPYNEKISPYISKITSQAQIFTDNYKGKIIGITGTKGKSTTSTLLFLTLQNAGYKVKLVGNIGNPVLEEVELDDNYDYIIFEMSSYMLEGLKPQLYIGYINNIYNCHLDWHSGKENYTIAKLNVLKYSKNRICNFEAKDFIKEIEKITFFGESTKYVYSDKVFFVNGKQVLENTEIALKGDHNKLNIVGIISILESINMESNNFENLIKSLKTTLKSFSGLPHRIQNLGEFAGITFIDDAIATTPESTIAAINTFEHNIGTLLLGGQDSGFVFDNLVNKIVDYKIPNIVLFPDTGEKIFGDLSQYDYESIFEIEIKKHTIKILKTKSMKDAVNFAYQNTISGKICLLSNAAPSFSLWSGYIEKGTLFQKEVNSQNIK